MDSTTSDLGAALALGGLTVVFGLLVFTLACLLTADEPRRPREARRVAAWRRATPWLLVVSSTTAVVGLVVLRVSS